MADAALTPKLKKKAAPPSKELQWKCRIRANSWMWADTEDLVCGTSLTLLDVNCNTLSVTSSIFHGLDAFQLPWEQKMQPPSAGLLLPGPARTCRAAAHLCPWPWRHFPKGGRLFPQIFICGRMWRYNGNLICVLE